MNSTKLMHLIYTSAAASEIDASELTKILEVSRRKNSQLSVTGMLLFSSNSFFQVLEGDESILNELYATIAADPRHKNVTKIIEEPIAHRDLDGWTMGFLEVDWADLEKIDGLGDFFQQNNSLIHLPAGRAKKLLEAFAHGRWRAQLEGSAS